MSGYLAGKVWNSNLDPTIKPTAACLADCANDDGSGVFPSNEYLCWKLGLSEATVRRHMTELKNIGFLVCVANQGGGRGKVPVYEMDDSVLPERPSWREVKKGLKLTPLLRERGSSTEERGSSVSLKGLTGDQRNKEDPSVDPSVIEPPVKSSPPSEEGVSEKDSKFKTFTELIHKGFKRIGEPLTWGPAEGKQLKNLIRAAPWMSEQQFRTCLTNWHKSPSTNISDPPCLWLSKLPRYLNGPLDQFNRPLAPPPRPQATAEENLVE